MKIALYQHSVTEDLSENIEKALDAIRQASGQGADLICFPEIHFSPFFPQYRAQEVSEYVFTLHHPVVKKIQEVCRDNQIAAVPNFYLEEAGQYYDASPVIDKDGTLLGVSKMVHIIQMACYFEQDYYAPSDSGFLVYDMQVGKVGVVICFDRHIPESIRTCTLMGAQVIIVPTANMKGEPLEMFEWEMRVQAMHNGVFIAMCNRVGLEGEMDFAGESLVIDPNGEVILKADDQEQMLIADLDLDRIEGARRTRPYLSLRRPETYLK